MPAYTVVDAGWGMSFGAFRVKVSIDNLLNEKYEQFVGFPAQDRRLRVELRGTF
jgi:outer membrane receptor protein involved in Fe transport